MENIQSLTIDIMNNKYTDYIYSKQYDRNRIVDFTICENGNPLDPSELFCTFIMKYNDVVAFEFLELTDGKFRLILDRIETFQAGRIPYQLLVTTQKLELKPDPEDPEKQIIDWDSQPLIVGSVDGILLVEACVIDEDDAESQVDETVMDKLIDTLSKAGGYIQESRDNAQITRENAAITDENAKKSQSYAVGGTDYDHLQQDGSYLDDDVDNSRYYYEMNKEYYDKMTKYKLVILERYGWVDNLQTVSVRGIEDDESKQLVTPVPREEDINAYIDSGIMCIHQGTDELTFRCEIQPKKDIYVYIVTKITEEHKYSSLPYSNFVISNSEPTDLNPEDYWIKPY